jgi:hypothetical protein
VLFLYGARGGVVVKALRYKPAGHGCAVVMKSGNLNFLEPSGPIQACNGTALPLLCLVIFTFIIIIITPVFSSFPAALT